MKTNWIHISDLHYHLNNIDSALLRNDLISRIITLRDSDPFDSLYITGDICDKNGIINPSLVQYIENLIEASGVPIQNVFIVPGNHDHMRADKNNPELLAAIESIYHYDEKDHFREELRKKTIDSNVDSVSPDTIRTILNSFTGFNAFYNEIKDIPYYREDTNPHLVRDRTFDDINIIKLNTAWLDGDSKSEEDICIGTPQLLSLLSSQNFDISQYINIAVGHHPISMLNTIERRRVLDIFHQYNVKIYLCGHVHQPHITYDADYDILEIACGSSKSDEYYTGGYAIGNIDTEINCYKIEFFNWHEGKWGGDFRVKNTNDYGVHYLQTKTFTHAVDNVIVTLKMLGSSIPRSTIEKTIDNKHFEMIVFPYSNIDTLETTDWHSFFSIIEDFGVHVASLENENIMIFPLAPIPLLIHFGYQLQDDSPYMFFQYDQRNKAWVNKGKDDTYNSQYIVNDSISNKEELIIKIATSANIKNESIHQILPALYHECDFIEIVAQQFRLGHPLHKEDVQKVYNLFLDNIASIASNYSKIHIFAAVPSAVAIRIGQLIRKNMFPPVALYNYSHPKGGYEYCYTINTAI